MMPAIIKRIKRPEARDMAESILLRLGLKERMDHLIGELSGVNSNGWQLPGLLS